MKFKIKCANEGDPERSWWEDHEKDEVTDPHSWAKDTVQQFNKTLRPHEKPRILLDVKVLETDTKKDHDWIKQNVYTIQRGERQYDIVECVSCGITGKRYGLSYIQRDSQYRPNIYKRCDTAQVHLAKKRDRL